MEIKRVLEKTDGVKYVIVPMKSDIKKGDYVKIIKIQDIKIKELEVDPGKGEYDHPTDHPKEHEQD